MIRIIEKDLTVRVKGQAFADVQEQRQSVLAILEKVRQEGDRALYDYTSLYDQVTLTQLQVTPEEIAQAYKQVTAEFQNILKEAIQNIRHFHEQQKQQSWVTTSPSGTMLGQLVRPLERVGVYVPGGSAALVSSVMMTVIPALVAGVEEIILVSPPSKSGEINPAILVVADLLGIKEIFKVGGAQAIAALAYGTESIPEVDKIVGPGNIYVALAKKEVFGQVDIDMMAGPSDITVLADGNQNPRYIAADLLSQAEHDPLSSAICVTTSLELAKQIQVELELQLEDLPRADIARKALQNNSAIYVMDKLDEAINLVNQIAPEHLEILTENPLDVVGQIKNAGAIFVGEYSSEPVGDYFAGPNHVLPTNGTARFHSALGVEDFMKKSSLIVYSKADLIKNGAKIIELAKYEGLEGHARAIQFRFEALGKEEGN